MLLVFGFLCAEISSPFSSCLRLQLLSHSCHFTSEVLDELPSVPPFRLSGWPAYTTARLLRHARSTLAYTHIAHETMAHMVHHSVEKSPSIKIPVEWSTFLRSPCGSVSFFLAGGCCYRATLNAAQRLSKRSFAS